MIIRHLSIDCAYINKVLEPITQREHGVTEFEIEIKNHGADIDLSECTLATYYGLKPDEHKVGVECRVDKDKGLIYLPLYLQMTTAEGVLKGIVELQFPEGNVRFSGVNFKVSFAPDDTKIESTDDFNILENFISKPTTNGVVGQVLSIDNDGNTIWRTLKEFDGDYAHLSNRPSINGVELNGDKSLEDLNIKQTYTADDISFTDGETFQQKFNNGELKGQDGVSGTNGITPHIGDNGNWFIGETDTNKPSQGTNGLNGNDGVGITKSEVNTSGELVITYSNGDSTNLGKIVGKDGLDGIDGKDGIGITNAEINNSGELTLTYSNGTSANLGKVVGADGKDGADLSNEVEDIKAYIGYTDEDIAGLCVDYENKTFKRLAGAVGLSQGSDFNKFTMYGGRKRCNVSDDGTIVAYYGDEGYTEDGSNGQVMVFQPKFYYKVVPLKLEKNNDSSIGYHLRKVNYYVSSKPKTGFKLHPAFFDENGNAVDYILFSADEGSMFDVSAGAYVNDNVDESITYEDGDLLCSVAGKKSISGLRKGLGTKSNLEQMAQNRGSGWHLETIKATSANQLLMIIELGTMNSQTGIGQGIVSITDNKAYNCSSLTGSTAELGNSTGQATETVNEIGGTETTYNVNGKVSVTYRGVENPYGNIFKHIQGVNVWGDGSMCGGQPYVANNFTFNESKNSDNYEGVGFTLPNANGYINAMGYGKEEYDWLLLPSEIGGTSALPVGDFFYVTSDLNDYRIVLGGGSWNYGSFDGSFFGRCGYNVGSRDRSAGGRLLYVPTAKV